MSSGSRPLRLAGKWNTRLRFRHGFLKVSTRGADWFSCPASLTRVRNLIQEGSPRLNCSLSSREHVLHAFSGDFHGEYHLSWVKLDDESPVPLSASTSRPCRADGGPYRHRRRALHLLPLASFRPDVAVLPPHAPPAALRLLRRAAWLGMSTSPAGHTGQKTAPSPAAQLWLIASSSSIHSGGFVSPHRSQTWKVARRRPTAARVRQVARTVGSVII